MNTIMKSMLAVGLALGFGLSIAGNAEAAKRKSCAVLGGQGTGVLQEGAKDQALWQLDDAAKAYGGKVAGKAKVACTGTLVAECTAKQRYCK